jgi:hypothetical protein
VRIKRFADKRAVPWFRSAQMGLTRVDATALGSGATRAIFSNVHCPLAVRREDAGSNPLAAIFAQPYDADLFPIVAMHLDLASLLTLRATSRDCKRAASVEFDPVDAKGRWHRHAYPLGLAHFAGLGDLRMVQFARMRSPPIEWEVGVAEAAAFRGHIHVLKWACYEADPPLPMGAKWAPPNDHGGHRTLHMKEGAECAAAAKGGQLETLQWMRSQSPPFVWNGRVYTAAANGFHVDVLRWAWQHACPEEGTISGRHWATEVTGSWLKPLKKWRRQRKDPRNDPCAAAELAKYLRIAEWMRAHLPAEFSRAIDRCVS